MPGSPAVWYQTADGIRPFADGQTIYGSPAAGGNMVMASNPTGTPGKIVAADPISSAIPASGAGNSLYLETTSATSGMQM
jgi:hypothetical protein